MQIWCYFHYLLAGRGLVVAPPPKKIGSGSDTAICLNDFKKEVSSLYPREC